MKQYDIIIIGEGIVGLSLATALLDFDLKLAIIAKEPAQSAKVFNAGNYDSRVSAITIASERIFKRLQIWDDIVARRISPFRDMQVWDASGVGQIHFDSACIGLPHLGHIIENSVMTAALQKKLYGHPKLDYFQETQLNDLIMTGEGVIIKTPANTLFAKLLIGADGANSWVREHAGFKLKPNSYNQLAIVSTVQTELPHQETALQRFLATGPLAFLPLNHSNKCSIVWSCDTETAQKVLSYNDEQFCQHVAEALEFKLGKVLASTPRQHFPLVRRHVEHYVMSHIALVGDAAHTVHPMIGQGLNMGLLDMAKLVDVIDRTLELKRPLGYLPLLRQYERERRTENLLLLKMVDMFHQLFSNDHPLLSMIRNHGLHLTDQINWLKTMLMHHAVGNHFELPSLAKEL